MYCTVYSSCCWKLSTFIDCLSLNLDILYRVSCPFYTVRISQLNNIIWSYTPVQWFMRLCRFLCSQTTPDLSQYFSLVVKKNLKRSESLEMRLHKQCRSALRYGFLLGLGIGSFLVMEAVFIHCTCVPVRVQWCTGHMLHSWGRGYTNIVGQHGDVVSY